MSLTFSLKKSATHLSFLFIGTAASLLGTHLLPTKAQQPVVQSAIALPNSTNHQLIADWAALTADSSTNIPGVPEKVGGVGMMLGVAIGAGAVGIALNTKKDRTSRPSSTLHRSNSSPGLISAGNSIRIEQASRKLQKKLLRLLHDDRDTANRLLSQVKTKNPNRSTDWYVEKVIYDLERDRGGY